MSMQDWIVFTREIGGMKYRKLGSSGIEVSDISLGSWLTYSGGVEKAQSIACVHRALDVGITLIDTANIYGKGAAETVLGEALAGVQRESYVLATKLYFPMTETDKGLSRAQIEKQLEASLKRLKVDYVDLYQCHRYDHDTPLDETMEAMSAALRSGKTRAIGFSEWPVEKIRAATVRSLKEIARKRGYTQVRLNASDAGMGVYSRIGFERTTEMRCYLTAKLRKRNKAAHALL